MRNNEDGTLGSFIHVAKNLDQIVKAPKVDSGLGLVKNRELCAACIDHCNLNSLELAARKRAVNLAVYVVLCAKADLGKICTRLGNRNVLARCDGNELLDGDSLKAHGLLESKADAALGALGDGKIGDVDAIQKDLARRG